MAYNAKILADSIAPHGVRLTTFEVTFPRIVLAEFNTHRMLSRNSASSRAIPVDKRIAMIEADPFIPESFGKNQKGMQATGTLVGEQDSKARDEWMRALDDALAHARKLAQLEVHKQLANRILEPFCWHTVIVTATEWDNFWALRCSKEAQPEICKPAEMMRDLYRSHTPAYCDWHSYHLPLLDDRAELVAGGYYIIAVSIGRCARVSYLTHDGKRDPNADIELFTKLKANGHLSPTEHVARPIKPNVDGRMQWSGNFKGWFQYRKAIINEACFVRESAA